MKANGIEPIDMVVVNLYPFEATVAKPGVHIDEAIENIDIGGPTMLRSSAKNYKYVTVVVSPDDYQSVLAEIKKNGNTTIETRQRLAVKVFEHTASYDSAIQTYLEQKLNNKKVLRLYFNGGETLRYGENSHQSATFYKLPGVTESCMATAEQLHGKELSYNNLVDGEAAHEAVKEIKGRPAVVIIKHTNPCGFATGNTLAQAFENAWQGDIVSAFGSVIAVNRQVDMATAQLLKGRFVEILIASGFDADALEFLKQKSTDIRILKVPSWEKEENTQKKVYRNIIGGMLEQDRDALFMEKWEVVTKAQFPEAKVALANFAWGACKHTKSNAIIFAREYAANCFQVVGMGAGQPNRLDSTRKLAATKARENIERFYAEQRPAGSLEEFITSQFNQFVMASDAFFPFPDNIEAANSFGIKYILQPGGSKKDSDVVAACNTFGIAMALTGTRHFRH